MKESFSTSGGWKPVSRIHRKWLVFQLGEENVARAVSSGSAIIVGKEHFVNTNPPQEKTVSFLGSSPANAEAPILK